MPARLGQHAAIATGYRYRTSSAKAVCWQSMVRHDEDVPCGEGLGTLSAKLLPVSASEFASPSGNTGGQNDGDAVGLKSRT